MEESRREMRCGLSYVDYTMAETKCVAARQALGRVWRWRVPGNWSGSQCREEIAAEVALAVVELTGAKTASEPQRGTRHRQSRIQNKVRNRYRREWSFSKHIASPMVTDPPDSDRPDRESLHVMLQTAMAALSALDRWLMQRIYWEECTESQIAAERRVSVQAISRHKQRVLRHLHRVLKKSFEDEG